MQRTGRFIPVSLIPWWDGELAAGEIRRMAKQGVHAISLSDNPALHGFPSIHSDHWDPVWKACADNNVVINCHIGTGIKAEHASDDSPIDAWIAAMPISIANSAADWIWAPMWKKFPNLRMALSEGSIGWIPYLLERADFTTATTTPGRMSDFGERQAQRSLQEAHHHLLHRRRIRPAQPARHRRGHGHLGM
jgi:predicted TIM-barrel fold metal-dependent hydrolase